MPAEEIPESKKPEPKKVEPQPLPKKSEPEIKIVSMKAQVPYGWKVMTLEEGKELKHRLSPMLGAWSIVGFDRGKLDGSGYGSKIHDSRGGECGEVFIIKYD